MKKYYLKNIVKCAFSVLTIFSMGFMVNAEGHLKELLESKKCKTGQLVAYNCLDENKKAEMEQFYDSYLRMRDKSFINFFKIAIDFLNSESIETIRTKKAYIIGLDSLDKGTSLLINLVHLKNLTSENNSLINSVLQRVGYCSITQRTIDNIPAEEIPQFYKDMFNNNMIYKKQWQIKVDKLTSQIDFLSTILDKYCDENYGVSKEEVDSICDAATNVLKNEPHLLSINGPVIVVGDIHGSIIPLAKYCKEFLEEVRSGVSIIFLGDYVDRGNDSVKSATLILKLKSAFPNKVFLLRGNHENIEQNRACGFYRECRMRYDGIDIMTGFNGQGDDRCYAVSNFEQHKSDNTMGVQIYNKINSTFDHLPLAAVVNNSIFCVHGGISSQLDNINKINGIPKPLSSDDLNKNSLAMDLIWSDPNVYVEGFLPNTARGLGCFYGQSIVKEFFNINNANLGLNLKCIIRAHEEKDNGYEDAFGDRSVVTVFSSPNYCGHRNNGAVAYLNDGNIQFHCLR